jgi:release factor glutamine methyltransferase
VKVSSALKFLTEALTQKLPEDRAKREALEILAHLLRVSPLNVWLKLEEEVPDETLNHILSRRLTGEPLPYILGIAYFFGRPFYVEKEVLIPRPETEVLIEHFLEVAPPQGVILDLGIGSGILAITILLERPNYIAFGVDISKEALKVAQRNANLHEVSSRLYLILGDALKPLKEKPLFTAIVSNPPYISEEEFETLDEEVRLYEPRVTLVSGKTGLEFYELILQHAPKLLQEGGFILVELGYNQGKSFYELAKALGYKVDFKKDLLGYQRSAVIWREENTS